MPAQHTYDLVASRLATWLDETAQYLADGMRENGRAPLAADASEAEKQRYYEDTLWNPDGSPNVPGRQAALNRLGVENYAKTLHQVEMARRSRVGGTDVGVSDGAV